VRESELVGLRSNRPKPRGVLEITESGVELRTDLSTVDVDSERLRSICFAVLL
jgi:hypothetical protein